MTIHTTIPEKETYVRIEVNSITHENVAYHGCVGKVVAEGDWGNVGQRQMLILVRLVGDNETKVFSDRDVVEITRKEYFQEALKSG